MGVSDAAVAALRAGKPIVLPTDTVYGLCADPYREEAVRALFRIKKRPSGMPVALVAADLDAILAAVPELRGRTEALARALLPGAYTLVVPNPAGRLPWLTGASPDAIGIRVPELPREGRAVLDRFGAVAATSANLHGGPDPARIEDLPEDLRSAVGAMVDAGPLPGTPSTVVDLTGVEPQILREGAVSAADALSAIARAATE